MTETEPVEIRAVTEDGEYLYDDLGCDDKIAWLRLPDDAFGRYIRLNPSQLDVVQSLGGYNTCVLWGLFWCPADLVVRQGEVYLRAETAGTWR